MGSDRRIGHAPCRSQICAQDPDSWPAALNFVSSPPMMKPSCPGSSLVMRAGFTVTTLRQSNNPPSGKVPRHQGQKKPSSWKQCQERDHHFLWRQRDCAQRICPCRPNCEFRVLMRHFAATVWKWTKMLPQTLARTDLAASPWQRPVSHFHPRSVVSGEKQNGCHPPTHRTSRFGTLWLLPVSKNENEAERMPVWYYWGDTGQFAESAWQSDRKGLSGSIPKMEETVGPVSTWGRELLWGWWQPIGLMVSFAIFTASIRKISDTTL